MSKPSSKKEIIAIAVCIVLAVAAIWVFGYDHSGGTP